MPALVLCIHVHVEGKGFEGSGGKTSRQQSVQEKSHRISAFSAIFSPKFSFSSLEIPICSHKAEAAQAQKRKRDAMSVEEQLVDFRANAAPNMRFGIETSTDYQPYIAIFDLNKPGEQAEYEEFLREHPEEDEEEEGTVEEAG